MPRKPTAPRPFVGIDGEGWGPDGEPQRYTLLQTSEGDRLYDPAGLTWRTIFPKLVGLPGAARIMRPHKRRDGHGRRWSGPTSQKILVGFGLTYDFSMWIRHLPRKYLRELYANGRVTFLSTREGTEGFWTVVWEHRRKMMIGHRCRNVWRSVTIYDVFAFFQSSFVSALRREKILDSETLDQIEAMKLQRGDFEEEDVSAIEEYNALEVSSLVKLVDKLREALEAAGVKLSTWTGPGAVAGAVMHQKGVKNYLPDADAFQPTKAIMRAYGGGRAQSLQVGYHEGTTWQHDINSAYPAAIQQLPCLKHGRWEKVKRYEPEAAYAIWKVSWDVGCGEDNPYEPLTPFAWRGKHGNVSYPRRGRGYAYNSEVTVAMRLWGSRIRILSGYVWRAGCTHQPFGWVPDMYRDRRAYKQAGNPAEKILKLVLNSLYGKTAQAVGYQDRPPPYQCYPWAGWITSYCRAEILNAASQAPSDIVAFATDGVFSRSRLDVPEGKELGEWDVTPAEDLFMIQPGVRWQTEDGVRTLKSRGFHPNELDESRVREQWNRTGPDGSIEIKVKRFLGFQLAMARGRPDQIGVWETTPKVLQLRPARGHRRQRWRWRPSPVEPWQPPVGVPWVLSEPYVPKTGRPKRIADLAKLEALAGQVEH